MSPTEDLFASGLGREPRMHIAALGGSTTPVKVGRPVEPPWYNEHRQHIQGRNRSERYYY